jgi:nucleoside-diphosphate-sugar epimerase
VAINRIAVTGAGGFIGRALVRRLCDSGLEVRALVRRHQDCRLPNLQIIEAGDLTKADLPSLLEGCDAVINLAARVHITREVDPDPETAYARLNCDFVVDLAESARRAGVGRFVQMSSVAALSSVTPLGVVANDDFDPRPLSPYGRSKLAGDEALARLAGECGLSVVSLRPPTVFGPGVGAYFRQLMRFARLGLPLPLGRFNNMRSFIFVDNLTDALLAATLKSIAGTFIVTDSPPISVAALYRRLLEAHGRPAWLPAIPQRIVKAVAGLVLGGAADSLLASSAFDGSRFANAFEWRPPVEFGAALQATVRAG